MRKFPEWTTFYEEQLQNRLRFALRNFLQWQPPFQEKSETKLFEWSAEVAQNAEILHQLYNLSTLSTHSSRQRYLETLTYLEWLEWAYQSSGLWGCFCFNRDDFRWLDVGAKNWSYVEALAAFIRTRQSASPTVELQNAFRLDGIELDPHRRYTSFHTRGQTARSFIRYTPEAHYHEANVLTWTQKATCISHFMPFVYPEPHLAWGLPLHLFNPPKVLAHLISVLEPGGLLLIINQGTVEAEEQKALFKAILTDISFQYEFLGQCPSSFIRYQYPRYGWLLKRNP